MKFKYIFIAAAAFAATALGSCSDDKFEPGEAVSPDSPGVCFVKTEKTYLCGSTDTEYVAKVQLEREKTDGALTVPIKVLYADKELIIPSTATFAAGESRTVIELKLDKTAEILTKYNFTIGIENSLTNPYAEGPGLSAFTSCVVVAKSYTADCRFDDAQTYSGGHFDMQLLQTGASEYVLIDFMGCGKNLTVKVGSDKVPEISGDIAIWDADYGCWDIWDDESDDFRLYFGPDHSVYMDELYLYKSGSKFEYMSKTNRNRIYWQTWGYIQPSAPNGMWDWFQIYWDAD